MKTETKKLKNGAKIIGIKMPGAKSVVINFGFRAGSRNEDPKYAGISHFLEHMMFKGSQKRPSAKEISRDADKIGAYYNAATEKEWTYYYIKTIKDNFDLSLDIVGDMVTSPILDKNELEKEKGTIIEEIRMYKDTPSQDIEWRMEETMFGKNSPLGRDEGGTEESVLGISQKQMLDYYKKHYVGQNCVCVVAGDLPNDYNERVEKYLKKLKPGESDYVKIPQIKKPSTRLIYKETEQAHVGVCIPGISISSEEKYAMQVITAALGGYMSSRLFIEIREKRGLAYYVRSSNVKYSDTGSIEIVGGFRKSKIEEAVKIIKREIANIKNLSDEEIERAKGNLRGINTLIFDDPERRAGYTVIQNLISKKPESPEEYIKKITEVDNKKTREVAKKFLDENKLYLTIIGPYKNKEKFDKILNR